MKKFLDAFAGSDNFRFARAESSLVLTNGFPGDGTSTATDDVAGERSEFEEFDGGTVRY